MGCICSKTSAVEDSREGLRAKLSSSSKRTSELNVSRLNSSKRDEGVWTKNVLDGSDVKVSLIGKKASGSVRLYDDQIGEEKIEKPELTVLSHPGLGKVPKAIEGEQVAAGWPAWLSSVAGEAIKGWIPRSANTFERLYKVSYFLLLSVHVRTIVQLPCNYYLVPSFECTHQKPCQKGKSFFAGMV